MALVVREQVVDERSAGVVLVRAGEERGELLHQGCGAEVLNPRVLVRREDPRLYLTDN